MMHITTKEEAEALANERITGLSLEMLVYHAELNSRYDPDDETLVSGWIKAELKKRKPAEFERWEKDGFKDVDKYFRW